MNYKYAVDQVSNYRRNAWSHKKLCKESGITIDSTGAWGSNGFSQGWFCQVFESITHQAGGKFILSKAIEGIHSNQIKEALELLFMAGLAYPVYHTSARGLPLGAQMNVKKFKVLIFDTGILCPLNLSQKAVKLWTMELGTRVDWQYNGKQVW